MLSSIACLFIEGPLSGITLFSQNAGSVELVQRSVPDAVSRQFPA